MKYIFCNTSTNVRALPLLCKKDNILYYNKGTPDDITSYYSNNTVIVLPYNSLHKTHLAERKKLDKIMNTNGMNIYDIGTAVWVPIDESKNYGVIFTSTQRIYWTFVSVVGLVNKFPFDIDTIIFNLNDFETIRFEEQFTKAMNAQKKLDYLPEIKNIYYNP